MCKTLWDRCVSIMVLDLLDGYVHLENPEDLAKTDAIACKVLEEIKQHSPHRNSTANG